MDQHASSPVSDTLCHSLDHKRVSVVLHDFFKNFSSPQVAVSQFTDALADRAFALLLLVFALPNLVPFPIPGISVFFGVPLMFLSFQFMLGRRAPWFPGWIGRRSLPRKDLEKVVMYVIPHIKKIERFLKPRLHFLLNTFSERVIALVCLVMAVLIALPIPLGNWFPAFTIFLLAVAVLERDGIFVVLGAISAVVSVLLVGTLVLAAVKAAYFVLQQSF
jgi:hypothetical protein